MAAASTAWPPDVFRQLRPYWCGPAALVALQLELGRGPQLSQAEWAELAGTTREGTGERGLQRCVRLLAPFRVVHRPAEPFDLAIVYDAWRDHWITVRCVDGMALMLDPWDGQIECYPWPWFRAVFFLIPRLAYALVISSR